MKKLFALLMMAIGSSALAQNPLKLQEIDRQVVELEQAGLPETHDSIVQNYPDMGLFMTTYLNAIVQDGKLLKYQNLVFTTQIEGTDTSRMETSSTFYFHDGNLIKVNEYGLKKKEKMEMIWYFENNELLHTTTDSEKSASRGALLLQIAQGIQEQLSK